MSDRDTRRHSVIQAVADANKHRQARDNAQGKRADKSAYLSAALDGLFKQVFRVAAGGLDLREQPRRATDAAHEAGRTVLLDAAERFVRRAGGCL